MIVFKGAKTLQNDSVCQLRVRKKNMSKMSAVFQLIFFVLLLAYGTYHLFRGQFEKSLAVIPIFAVYYVFVIARSKHNAADSGREDNEP